MGPDIAASQCDGKRAFESYSKAKNHYAHLRRKFPMAIYKCTFCGAYHAGKNVRKTKKLKTRQVHAD